MTKYLDARVQAQNVEFQVSRWKLIWIYAFPVSMVRIQSNSVVHIELQHLKKKSRTRNNYVSP